MGVHSVIFIHSPDCFTPVSCSLSRFFAAALTKTYLITEQISQLKAYQSFASQTQQNNSSKGDATSLVNGTQKTHSIAHKKSNVGQNSRFLFDVDEDEDDEDEDYVDNAYSYAQHHKRSYSSGEGKGPGGGSGSCSGSGENSLKRARRQQQARTNQHMTRTRAATDPSLTRTSSSIFNIPTLARVHVLLQTIDSARKERDRVFQEYVAARHQQQQLLLLQREGVEVAEGTHLQAINQPTNSSSSSNGNRGFLTSITAEGGCGCECVCVHV